MAESCHGPGEAHANDPEKVKPLQFAKVAGVKMTVVLYRGNGPLVTDLVGGQILTGNMVAGDALQHVKSGKLVYVGVYAPKRSP